MWYDRLVETDEGGLGKDEQMNKIQLLEKNPKGWHLKTDDEEEAIALFTMLVTAETKDDLEITVNGKGFLKYEYKKTEVEKKALEHGKLVLYRYGNLNAVLMVVEARADFMNDGMNPYDQVIYRYKAVSAMQTDRCDDIWELPEISGPGFTVESCHFHPENELHYPTPIKGWKTIENVMRGDTHNEENENE